MPIIEKNSDEDGFFPAGGFAMTALTGLMMHVPDNTCPVYNESPERECSGKELRETAVDV